VTSDGPPRIEPLTDADVEALAALAREIWYAHYPAIISAAQIEYMLDQRYRPETVRAELARADIGWDKLVVGGAMIGFSSYFRAAPAREMKLDKLYVHPRRQRLGYGGLMIARAADAARREGCDRLVLAVNKNNASAIAAYRKHGFQIAQSVTKDIGGGFVMDDYVMVRAV
jgi:ribosomal protein S18 acetylase RimI-like enzyme